MAEPILDKASYSLVRTNPKLTGNVKLITNDHDLYLESFSANTTLSSSSFKAFKIDGTQTYDQDVNKFFKNGALPTELAYEVFQEFQDTSVLSSFDNQYEMFYSAGTRSLASEVYTEDLGMLAPLWLNEEIPNYFVVFRLNDPSSVNNVNAILSSAGETAAQTAENFSEFVLQNCTAIKTFDLTETSKLGSYLRRYRGQETFPKAPLTVTWRKDEPFLWNGISYNKGGFTSGGNFSYDGLITKDATILQNEYYFTQGFQRNGILLANLINLEFLFSDTDASDYSINRYFGLYVNSVEEGKFKISGEGFYGGIEKTQLPKIKTITEVSQFLNTPFNLTNRNGILLYLDGALILTNTGIPTPTRVNEVESIFYVKDKKNQFHTVKKGSIWGNNQLRLFDTTIDISLFSGFNEPDTFATAQVLKRKGKATSYIQVIGEFPNGSSITFFDGTVPIGQVTANETLTTGPGSQFESFFNPKGTVKEIANAINKAIRFGINEKLRYFDSSINGSIVYLQSRFVGSRFNRLRFVLDWLQYPELDEAVITYPVTSELNTGAFFVGGTDNENSLIIINPGDQDRFIKGDYVKSKAGFVTISDWVPYLEEPIISGNGTQTGYKNIDNYVILSLIGNQIDISRSGQVALYSDFTPTFGRFSFFPIKDLDFDFYSEAYSQLGELDYEFDQYNQTSTPSTGFTGFTGSFTGSSFGYLGTSTWPDIRSFYDEGGFSNLIGLLKDSDPDITYDIDITSEYQRLEENFLRDQAVASRVTPYINKWVWYDDGTDVRNNSYRLNVNLAFGTNNFAPSRWNTGRSPDGYSHEWYYLSEFPSYFGADAIESSWSYFDQKPVDNIEANIVTNALFVPGTFQRIDKNMFDEYFIADRFVVNNDINLIDRQLRFGRFKGGDRQNFAESFLRGVRVIAKTKASGEEKPNFNAKKLSYIADGKFNDYRFSAMLVPNAPGKPKNKIKIIKNDKWKTVVVLIFVSFDSNCLNPTGNAVDRTLLYSMNSAIETQSDCSPLGSNVFENSIMQGSINFLSSNYDNTVAQYLIQGATDINGVPTAFFRDILVGADGQYNSIEFTIGGDTYLIAGISKIISNSQLYASTITKNTVPIVLPSPVPSVSELRQATYALIGGGFNGYSSTFNNVSFANVLNSINEGDPNIIYETIDTGGNQVRNADGSLAQTFSIELRAQEDILKSSYLGILPDPNKPTIFNLIDLIGYDLTLQTKPRINPIGRHAGWYKPLANDVIFFRDPYANIDFNNGYYTGSTSTTGVTGAIAETFVIRSVANPDLGQGGAIYEINGVNKPVLNLIRGGVYIFDVSDQSNANHPLRFRRLDGTQFNDGVTINGTQGIAGATVVFTVPNNAPNSLQYFCTNHPLYMGNTITVSTGSGGTGSTGTGNPGPDELYKFRVFTLCRYKNTQFYSNHKAFATIKNAFYHKVNQEDPSTVLELSTDKAFLSLYPLINEVGIGYKDCYLFSSNWEPGYFIKSIDKSKIQSVIGTSSMKEKKAFLASKYLKVPQQIVLETFIPSLLFKDAIKDPSLVEGTFMHSETSSYVEFYLFIQKRLTEYLFSFIKPVFEKYVNPKFGFGDTTTLNDDVNKYIEQNILSLYKIGSVDFYVKQSREKKESTYTTAELTNSEKTAAGLKIDQNISTKTLNTNLFDLRLIYNKRTGFSDSYGFSVTIIKK